MLFFDALPFLETYKHIHGSRHLVDLDVLVKLIIDNEKRISCPQCKILENVEYKQKHVWYIIYLLIYHTNQPFMQVNIGTSSHELNHMGYRPLDFLPQDLRNFKEDDAKELKQKDVPLNVPLN